MENNTWTTPSEGYIDNRTLAVYLVATFSVNNDFFSVDQESPWFKFLET
jgi:hypothetical protein